MLESKEDIINLVLQLLTDHQVNFIKTYIKNDKVRIKTAKDLHISPEAVDKYREHPKIRIALDAIEGNLELQKKYDSPTIEWTIRKYMDYLKKAEAELIEVETEIIDISKKEDKKETDLKMYELLTQRRERLEKNIQDYLKMTTDHQKKFGEIIDNKVKEFKAKTIPEMIEQWDKLTERFDKIRESFSWRMDKLYGDK